MIHIPTYYRGGVSGRILKLLLFYLGCGLLFFFGKLLFAVRTWGEGESISDFVSRIWGAWWHGLPLDISMSGYLISPLLLILLGSLWVLPKSRRGWNISYNIYAGAVSLIAAMVIVGDAMLYTYWGFKLDATIFVYLGQPEGITNSVSLWEIGLGFLLFFILWFVGYWCLQLPKTVALERCRRPILGSILLILFGGVAFLGIRGGVGRSTANVGMVYYSNDALRNHSAVNPVFSLFASISKTEDFGAEFNYFDEEKRQNIFDEIGFVSVNQAPLADTLFTTARPNVVVVLMEGMGAQFVESLGGVSNVTPNLERLSHEGIWFTQCYANSFRTDRGTVSAFSGYPAVPTVSVMRVQSKVNVLPGIAKTLLHSGYDTEFIYGGDVDFTGTKGYLLATGYQKVMGDKHFPAEARKTHGWGVTDAITFDTLYQHIVSKPVSRPWHIGFLTLASHEPWQVPYQRIEGDEIANSMAYLDDCIGRLVSRLKQTPQWKNLVLVFLPDHGIRYPQGVEEDQPRKHHIPLLMVGGAVKKPCVVDVPCNQSDMAATLLGQMQLPLDDFMFSRNVFSTTYHPIAFFTWGNGIGIIEPQGYTVYDIIADRTMHEEGQPNPRRTDYGKAYLQTVYDDLGGVLNKARK